MKMNIKQKQEDKMKRTNIIILIAVFIGVSLSLPQVFYAEENALPQQEEPKSAGDTVFFKNPSEQDLQHIKMLQVKKKPPKRRELSPLEEAQIKESMKLVIIERLRQLYEYKSGDITIGFTTRNLPDIMTMKDGKIFTGDAGLDILLDKYGFKRFRIVGTPGSRDKFNLRMYNYVFVHSDTLEDKARAFQRAVDREIKKAIEGFEVNLYLDKDMSYPERLALNLQAARKYIEDEVFRIKLWEEEMTFKYQDREKDSFTSEIIEKLKLLPGIKHAYPTPIYRAASESGQPGDDPDYFLNNSMWGLNYSEGGSYPMDDGFCTGVTWVDYERNESYDEDIDLPEFLALSLDPLGDPVIIAVLDTGIDFYHHDFSWDRFWVNPGEDINGNGVFDPWLASQGGDIDGIDNDGNYYIDDVHGFNLCGAEQDSVTGEIFNNSYQYPDDTSSSVPYDDNGHGSQMSGIIGANDDNSGVIGVDPNAIFLTVKVLDDSCAGYSNEVANGIHYVITIAEQYDLNIAAINLSLGFNEGEDPYLSDAIRDADDAGIVVVKAVGNESTYVTPGDNCDLDWDAVDRAIMVGASTHDSEIAPFSNWGPEGFVDVVAPGGSWIPTVRAQWSTLPAELIIGTTGSYDIGSGTSHATAYVSGLVALIKRNFPDLTPAQIQLRVTETAEPLYVSEFGWGPIPRSQQGFGKGNLTGALNPQPPEFTSTPSSNALFPNTWQYHAGVNGIINPVFDWPDGFTPLPNMVLDKGTGLITWAPDVSCFGENEIALLAKNLATGESVIQNFTVNVGISTDPEDYLIIDDPEVGLLTPENTYFPDQESYTLPVTIPGAFAEFPEVPVGSPSVSYVFGPWTGSSLVINGMPLASNIWGVPNPGYMLTYGWGPLVMNTPTMQSFLELNWWTTGTMAYVCWWPDLIWWPLPIGDEYDPYNSKDYELILSNSPYLNALYGLSWTMECYRQYRATVVVTDGFTNQEVIEIERDSIQPLLNHTWEETSYTFQKMKPSGRIQYTDTNTGEVVPLSDAKIIIWNAGYASRPPYVLPGYIWTDEDGNYECPIDLVYSEAQPPYLLIFAQNRDSDYTGQFYYPDEAGDNSPIVAEVRVKPEHARLASSEMFWLPAGGVMDIVLTPEGDSAYFNACANILKETHKAYDYLKENTDILFHGQQEQSGGRIRDRIICYYDMSGGDSAYNSASDEIWFFADPIHPRFGPSRYEIINNYGCAVLQSHLERQGIEEINCDGGVQNFNEELDSEGQALIWGFGDLLALRVYEAEELQNIYYNGEDYNIELEDFERFPGIRHAEKSLGAVSGVLFDAVDGKYDPSDELNGSMSSPPGPDSNFNYIFKNIINTAFAAVESHDPRKFSIGGFYSEWLEYGYPDPVWLQGIYQGHGLDAAAPVSQ